MAAVRKRSFLGFLLVRNPVHGRISKPLASRASLWLPLGCTPSNKILPFALNTSRVLDEDLHSGV